MSSNKRAIGCMVGTPDQFLLGITVNTCEDEEGVFISYEIGFLLFSIEYRRYITDRT